LPNGRPRTGLLSLSNPSLAHRTLRPADFGLKDVNGATSGVSA
jgi:hypothetical protein